MPSQQTIETVSLKVVKLKQLEEDLTKAVSARVNELNEECFKAMAADSDNMGMVVTFRLDCLSEFLQNLLIKVQDAEHQMGSGQDAIQYPVVMKSISSLIERMDRLESAVEAKDGSDQENEIRELQVKVEKLTCIKEQKQQSPPALGNNQTVTDLHQEVTVLKQKVETLDTEKTAMEKHLKKEIERIDRERQTMRTKLSKIVSKQKAVKKELYQKHSEVKDASQVLAKKVVNLEVLKDSLNQLTQNAHGGPKTAEMIKDAQSEIASLKASHRSLDELQNKISRSHVGFTALIKEKRKVGTDTAIKQIFDVLSNAGNCFKPHQGHFVVPHDGLYGFCVKLEAQGDKHYTVSIMSKDAGGEAVKEMDIPVCGHDIHSALCVLDLYRDRRIFLKVTDVEGMVKLWDTVSFSGWSIGYD